MLKCILCIAIVCVLVDQSGCSCPGCPEEVQPENGEWGDKIKEAADFAIHAMGEGYTLQKIVTAKTQVVHGTNYMLKLKVKKDGTPQTCNVVVYEHLPDRDTGSATKELTGMSCQSGRRSGMHFYSFSY